MPTATPAMAPVEKDEEDEDEEDEDDEDESVGVATTVLLGTTGAELDAGLRMEAIATICDGWLAKLH